MHLALSGEDGIRTHVPVKANGFQDRLVMTTSIPLQRDYLSLLIPFPRNQRKKYIIIRFSKSQRLFLYIYE